MAFIVESENLWKFWSFKTISTHSRVKKSTAWHERSWISRHEKLASTNSTAWHEKFCSEYASLEIQHERGKGDTAKVLND